jgi:hypothetical protein
MDSFFMDTYLNPMLAILAILVPLGWAYINLLSRVRKSTGGRRKAPVITPDEPFKKRAELFHDEEKFGTR